jgi:hypothetical protein
MWSAKAAGAGMAFLARLEHEFDGAFEFVAVAMQQMHRLDQHRRMRIMAAGMHAAGGLAGEVEPGFLRHRQRIHVAAQEDRAAALRAWPGAAQRDDEPRGRFAAGDLDIEPGEAAQHRRGRQRQIEPQFGPGVNAAAQRDALRQQFPRFGEETVQIGHDINSGGDASAGCTVHREENLALSPDRREPLRPMPDR